MNATELIWLRAVSILALVGAMAGCEDCGSIGRFTDKNGATVLVVCGQLQTLTPTFTPTDTPTPRAS